MKTSARWLIAIIALHLALGLVYDWATPIFEAPDEGYHFAVIRALAHGQGLPVQQPGVEHDWAQEGSQPPLYHALAAGLTFWIDMSDWGQTFVVNRYSQIGIPGTTHNVNLFRHTSAERFPYTRTALAVHIVRWFSLLLSVGTLLLTYRLACLTFPGRDWLALVAVAVVALNPKVIFINAAVNNDNLLMVLSAASVLVAVDIAQSVELPTWKKSAGLGVLLGLAALAKVSGLVLWPIAIAGLGWRAWRARAWRWGVMHGTLVLGLALLISGWWFARNQMLYGEWLGLQTMVAIAGPRTPALTLFELIQTEAYGFYRSYWGVFGAFTILEAPWVQRVFDGLTLWALIGGAGAMLSQRRWPRVSLILLGAFCLLTLGGVANWTLQTKASQGRLLFGAIAPLSIFMAAGLLAPLETRLRRPIGVWGLGAALAFFAGVALIIPIQSIAPRYAPPARLTEAELPVDLHPVKAVFADTMELIGYTFVDTPRRPGQTQSVTLYWRGLHPMPHDYVLALFLLGQSAETVNKIDTWPGGGRQPTSQWQAGDIFADTYEIPIHPEAAVPSILQLNVRLWEGVSENTLPIVIPSGEVVQSATMQVGRIIAASPLSAEPTLPLKSNFDFGIALLGVNPSPAGSFTLYWQTSQTIPGNYTVFAHLLDSKGQQVTQADSPPLNGYWPTWAWLPNQPFVETRQFDLRNVPPGKYTIQLGLYDPESLERLAAYSPSGKRWPDDGVLIENIIEVR